MNTQTAITLAGSKAKLAILLNVSRAAVTQYSDKLPPKREKMLRESHPEWFVNEPPMDTRIVLKEAILTPV